MELLSDTNIMLLIIAVATIIILAGKGQSEIGARALFVNTSVYFTYHARPLMSTCLASHLIRRHPTSFRRQVNWLTTLKRPHILTVL
jgi:hypothetical protein